MPLACAVCWKSNNYKNFVGFTMDYPQSFPQLRVEMFQISGGREKGNTERGELGKGM
jgi:hypothetical protein